ncbi:uncharacterized protein BP5553_09456 [Venustampulla echinocandica]|uniref:LysM domain-containing protein n=1 Tax=Venustampulla echinocandica TaxID=2656787 RepID=A0A370TCU8_9HELO|nr:uncharacterized protein BP5553_09456 [Venustampulla echinocandica]RDL32054.1 hypothetical protein BP5553_09456 [Venustampulla echinocandica]
MRYPEFLVPAVFALLDVTQALTCDIPTGVQFPEGTPHDCCLYYIPTAAEHDCTLLTAALAALPVTVTVADVFALNPNLDDSCANLEGNSNHAYCILRNNPDHKGGPAGSGHKGGHKGESNGESNGDHKGESNGESNGDHKGESNGESNGDHKGESNGESNGDHKGESNGDHKGESNGDHKGESGTAPSISIAKPGPTGGSATSVVEASGASGILALGAWSVMLVHGLLATVLLL